MKITIVSVLLLAATVAFTSCSNKPTEQVKKISTRETYMDTVSHVLYPLDAAVQDVQLFSSLSKLYLNDSVPIRAYTIRAVDLLGALGMPGALADSSICQYKYIRVYFGYHKGIGFKIFLVPVQDADLSQSIGGTDIMLDSIGAGIDPKAGTIGKEYVLDLNAPCPNTCATSSPFEKK